MQFRLRYFKYILHYPKKNHKADVISYGRLTKLTIHDNNDCMLNIKDI